MPHLICVLITTVTLQLLPVRVPVRLQSSESETEHYSSSSLGYPLLYSTVNCPQNLLRKNIGQ